MNDKQTMTEFLEVSGVDPDSQIYAKAVAIVSAMPSGNPLEKLKLAAELLEGAFYDLDNAHLVDAHILRGLSVAEDLVADVVQVLEARGA